MDARTQESLAFLERIERVVIPSTTVEDDALFLVLDVRMKDRDPQLTVKQRKKQHKALRPHVDYSTTKAVKTLELVHEAIYDWSLKHQSQSQQSQSGDGDDQAPVPSMPQHCAYCSQFNSPAAMELWSWNNPPPPQDLTSSETPGLSVIVVVNELREFEKCLNSYVESARSVPEGLSESDCEGLRHIPSIVASFLQRAQIKTVGQSACGPGM